MKPVVILLGAGGHARVLIDMILEHDLATPFGILDPDHRLWGQDLFGVPVLGGDNLLASMHEKGVTHFVVSVGSVGLTRIRQSLHQLGISHQLLPLTLKHPSAIVSARATIGVGCQLLAGVVVNTNAMIGRNVILNTGVIVEHDCKIEDHVHLAPGVTLSGNCHVGIGAHLGTGAIVRQGISIGANAIVGAGAVVIRDVPAEVTVVGVPARIQSRPSTRGA
jgi:sugar O-acyltransferase (sialic acid O-acetyltransferase NeuD family)